MNPLEKVSKSFENNIIPKPMYELIEKRFSLVSDGILRIEKASSIKLPITISVNSKSINKIQNLENILSKMDLVSSYNILKFDSNNIYFKIIYNGSPKKFLQEMSKNKISVETQGQIWRAG